MTKPVERSPEMYEGTAPGFLWGIGSILLIFSSFAVGFSDDVAVLYPDHDNTRLMWGVGIAFGLLSMAVGLYFFRNAPARWVLAVLLFLMGGDAAGSLTWCIATRLELARDFPRNKVQTTRQLVPIVAATRSTGSKGRVDRFLELAPGWPAVEVDGKDYSFMLRYRPMTGGMTRDKIASNGFFCAIVTVEQTPAAKRIIGLASRRLPEQSVSLCPTK